MRTQTLVLNAMVAATYAGVALFLPATALANYRLSTALYVLAAWNPALIPGLALGNALAGLPQGFIDVVMGAVVGLATAWTCSRLGRLAPAAVLVVPTLMVPLWLSVMFDAPYLAVLPVVAQGQLASAILAVMLMRAPVLKRLVQGTQ